MTRAGIVTVVGRPNVGKSTLLNRIVGQKLSITSSKPQSTRDRIVGIRTEEDTQMIILDTPGLLNPRYALQRAMRAAAINALREADVILYLQDATRPEREPLEVAAQLDQPPRAPVITALNKVDALGKGAREELDRDPGGSYLISATTGEGLDALIPRLEAELPESPFLYPEDDVSTQHLRFFVAELVRETALDQLEEELPYSVACEIEEFREDRTPLYIRAVLHVERECQKRSIIGGTGSRIKEIGRDARLKIERLVGASVYLDLWVKVLSNWRKNPRALLRFGYRLPEDSQE
jgi:GTP-binding protein Era